MDNLDTTEKICKCGDINCLGSVLIIDKELLDLSDFKEELYNKYGKDKVNIELKKSPSSGEIFTKFYELHVIKKE